MASEGNHKETKGFDHAPSGMFSHFLFSEYFPLLGYLQTSREIPYTCVIPWRPCNDVLTFRFCNWAMNGGSSDDNINILGLI